jgi:hypothetical protein
MVSSGICLFLEGTSILLIHFYASEQKEKKAIHKKTITEMQSSTDNSIQTHLREHSEEEGLQV